MIEQDNIFVTGGAGTLGKAIAERRKREKWEGKMTVYSTSPNKHAEMRTMYPDVQFIQGDIRNLELLKLAMVGHDIVIHAAAVKYIPEAESYSMDTYDVNVNGSQTVCQAARETGMRNVLGISTDKACHPANAYGATKMLMEKIFQEYARAGGETLFQLVRYGNVLESVGSVIETWKNAVAQGKPVRITDRGDMTRFWLSPSQAVDVLLKGLRIPAGRIYIPKMPALRMEKLLDYMFHFTPENFRLEEVPMRPGEKLHETLLTVEEADFAEEYTAKPDFFLLHPTTDKRIGLVTEAYASDTVPELTLDDFNELMSEFIYAKSYS